jgi:Kdo2-lipid IVA lauroyltransferase/acyltransferase
MSLKESNTERYRFRLSLLHPRYWLTWLGLALYFLFTLLPMPVIDRVGCRLGNIAAGKNKKRFSIVKTNLSLCFPDKDPAEIEQMAVEHFQVQFRSLMHYFILWWRPYSVVKKKISTIGFEQISDYQQQGKNIIVLLTHNVGLEFACTAISMDRPTSGPYKEIRNAVINWMIANGRMRFGKHLGGKLFTRDDGLKPLIRETRKGQVLIYLADEDLGVNNSVFVPFFGVQKATISVLGRLAKSCDAVVLPCASCYDVESRRYTITLLPRIEGLPSGDDEQDSLSMNKAIEEAIERCPIQYLWTLRYFQTRPPGEVSVYE